MAIRVLGLASGVTTLEDHRHAIAALVTPAGILEARGGLFPGVPGAGDLVAVSAMQAKVTPFYAWIDGSSAALQAGYDFCCDADVVLTFDAGEPAVARVDRVIARVKHTAYDSSGATVGSVEVLKGQASGAATAMPPSSELMWEVTVPAGASAGSGGINFATARADRRRYTVAAGGLLPAAAQADRDAVANPYNGQPVYRRDRRWVEIHDGVSWKVLTVPIVASVADLAAIPNPVAGQVAWNTGDNRPYVYISGAWKTWESNAVPVQFTESTTHSAIASTTYTAGTVDCGGTFIAPTSGRVSVQIGLNATGANPNRIYCSWEIRQTNAAGAVVVAAVDANGILTDWAGGAQVGGMPTLVTGLTAGSTYYIRTMHRVLGGTAGSIFVRRLTVTPTV